MTHEKRVELIRKQIEAYTLIISGMKACAELVRKWHGKIYDKRFADAFRDTLGQATSDAIWGYAKPENSGFYVSFGARSDYIPLGQYGGVAYIKHRDCAFNFDSDEAFDFTPGGKRRINADKILPCIDRRISDVQKDIADLEYLLAHFDDFKASALAVKEALAAFQQKWSYDQQSYGGASFSLRNDAFERDWNY